MWRPQNPLKKEEKEEKKEEKKEDDKEEEMKGKSRDADNMQLVKEGMMVKCLLGSSCNLSLFHAAPTSRFFLSRRSKTTTS